MCIRDSRDPPVKKKIYSFEEHPWGSEQMKNKIYIVPINKEVQFLFLNFPVPDINILHQYDAAVSIIYFRISI